ncbi:hypothetical protein BDV26DRAFT_264391 [Aspergillus bertholletiae]|uniref:Uncharacterized protein n=1 Tax=Aspergillus bertholletiae TaxID=1226010 RepID=A0A5N7B4Y1_9EURO|nr:hypothetical protein BDV26DRAFT_264391 [Aspergillus bertholletiae]
MVCLFFVFNPTIFSPTMMNNVVAPIIPFMVTYTVQAKRTTENYLHSSICYVVKKFCGLC